MLPSFLPVGHRKKQRAASRPKAGQGKLWFILLVVCVFAGWAGSIAFRPPAEKLARTISFVAPRTLDHLLALSPGDLARCDIALRNLLCAEGLTDTNTLGLDEALHRLDLMAGRVRMETDRLSTASRTVPRSSTGARASSA